jgi:glycosyltransferase involved in cell wall biosynthesis
MTDDLGEQITVCLLTYNHVDLIPSTLSSILDQTVSGYEVLVSDDCSTDGTWERILSLAADDPRIRPIRTPRNLGMPGNANFAVAQSRRPYIALLHHDDLYRKDLLEKWAAVLQQYPDVAFVFNPYAVSESDFIHEYAMPGSSIDGKWLLHKHLFAQWGCIVRGTAMIRREAWEEVGGMREEFELLADVDLWVRLAMRWRVGYVHEPVITVRQERPSYYPDIYQSLSWSWRRQRILYEIHSSNRLAFLNLKSLKGRLQWWGFRMRLNCETTKWLIYALVRKRPEIIISSRESVTRYDLWPLRFLRHILQLSFSLKQRLSS